MPLVTKLRGRIRLPSEKIFILRARKCRAFTHPEEKLAYSFIRRGVRGGDSVRRPRHAGTVSVAKWTRWCGAVGLRSWRWGSHRSPDGGSATRVSKRRGARIWFGYEAGQRRIQLILSMDPTDLGQSTPLPPTSLATTTPSGVLKIALRIHLLCRGSPMHDQTGALHIGGAPISFPDPVEATF